MLDQPAGEAMVTTDDSVGDHDNDCDVDNCFHRIPSISLTISDTSLVNGQPRIPFHVISLCKVGTHNRVQKNPGFLKKAQPTGFLGVLLGFIGFLDFLFEEAIRKLIV